MDSSSAVHCVGEVMGLIAVGDSDFFSVLRSCHVDQFTFHISLPNLKFTIFIHNDADVSEIRRVDNAVNHITCYQVDGCYTDNNRIVSHDASCLGLYYHCVRDVIIYYTLSG